MRKLEFKTTIQQYDSLEELNPEDRILVEKALEAAAQAYAPYSGFMVGAALRLDNHEIITGNNQENAAYPSGLCAERVAMFFANSQFPDSPVKAMAVTAIQHGIQIDSAVFPCGSCRQVILEEEIRFGEKVRLIMAGRDSIMVVDSIRELLPMYFDKSAFHQG